MLSRIRSLALLVVGLAALDATAGAPPRDAAKPLAPHDAYPRVEIFTEVARPPASPASSTSGQPAPTVRVVQRCIGVLSKAQAGLLPSQPLTFLPYFGEAKPGTTLSTFVDATGAAKAALLPRSLAPRLALPPATRATQATLADGELSKFERVVVVWLDAKRWYVDNVFYRFERFDPLALPRGVCDEVLEGTLAQFIRFSPLVTARRIEGQAALRHPKLAPMPPDDEPLFQVQRTPGGPGSHSFWVNLFADGSVGQAAVPSMPRAFAPHQLTAALIRASQLTLRLDAPGAAPRAPAHDRADLILQWWVAGVRHRFSIDGSEPPGVADLAQDLVRIYGLDNDPRRPGLHR
jgi:hypothetical protein